LSEPFIPAKQTCEIQGADAEGGADARISENFQWLVSIPFSRRIRAILVSSLRSVGTVVFPILDYGAKQGSEAVFIPSKEKSDNCLI
jgi:hypothetical protein